VKEIKLLELELKDLNDQILLTPHEVLDK